MPTLRPLRPCTLTTSHSGRIQLRCPLAVTEYRRATTTTGARRNSACKTWGRRLQLQPRSRGWKSASNLQSGDVCLLLTDNFRALQDLVKKDDAKAGGHSEPRGESLAEKLSRLIAMCRNTSYETTLDEATAMALQRCMAIMASAGLARFRLIRPCVVRTSHYSHKLGTRRGSRRGRYGFRCWLDDPHKRQTPMG